MTIALANSFPVEYAGNGAAVTFSFPWKISAATDLIVAFIVGGTYSIQSSTTYSITGIGNNGGGSITFAVAPPLGTTVDLRTQTPETQPTEFANLGSYLPENTTNACDRLTRMVQDLTRQTYTFGIHGPDTEFTAWPTLPPAVARAGAALIFDQNGLPAIGISTSQPLTQAAFNAFLQAGWPTVGFSVTEAEETAGVTVVNFFYSPGWVDRYGVNSSPGGTDMSTAVQAAVYQARAGGADVIFGSGPYLLGGNNTLAPQGNGAIDCTFTGGAQQNGLNFRQFSSPSTNLPPNSSGNIIVGHSAYSVFDFTGCDQFTVRDLSIITLSGAAPSCCFLTARNSTQESNFPRFFNTRVAGTFTVSILYNYGSEDGVYTANNWVNESNSPGSNCVVITANNYYKGSLNFMPSLFTTIATGPQSCIGHTFYGGDYSCQNPSTTSDVFYIEGGVSNLRLDKFWMMNCTNAPAPPQAGRSYVYNDTSNTSPAPAAALFGMITGIKTEVSQAFPTYGIFFGPASSNVNAIGWAIRDNYWTTNTYTIGGGANVTGIGFSVEGNLELNSRGLNWSGTFEDSTVNWESLITIVTPLRNVFIGTLANMTLNGVAGVVPATNTVIDQPSGNVLAGVVHSAAGSGIPAGGAPSVSLQLTSNGALGLYVGSGVPTISAAQGSLYLRTDGSSGSTRAYINTNGATSWVAVTTAS